MKYATWFSGDYEMTYPSVRTPHEDYNMEVMLGIIATWLRLGYEHSSLKYTETGFMIRLEHGAMPSAYFKVYGMDPATKFEITRQMVIEVEGYLAKAAAARRNTRDYFNEMKLQRRPPPME